MVADGPYEEVVQGVVQRVIQGVQGVVQGLFISIAESMVQRKDMGVMVIKKGVERVAAYSVLLYYIQLVYYPFGGVFIEGC